MAKSGAYLIGITDCTQDVCAASGRISTQSGTALEIFERSHDEEKNTKLIGKVTRSGHTSTIEHAFFNLAFENVSVVVEQFMIEFRLASFTVKSRRYVDFSDCGYYMPEFKNDEDKAEYTKTIDELFVSYGKLCESGIPKEDARFVLPYCFFSNFYCSLNGRELVNVLNAMIYGRGRKIKEIYEIGISLLAQAREKTPGIFSDFEVKGEKYRDEADLGFGEIAEDETGSDKCEILSVTQDGEKNVCRTALIEQYNYSPNQIEKILSDEENIRKILKAVTSSARARALESYNCTVRFNRVSLACLTHFARHRMQSICIPGLMKTRRTDYVVPETVKENDDLLKIYEGCFSKMAKLYESFKNKGYDENLLIYCVLSGCTLDIVTTMNAREMLLFFRLRSCTRAQWEIQEYAVDFLSKLRKISPDLFSHYGPSCYVTGVCPEGRLSCGRSAEIKEIFKSL
ncbi:MAG: FAD-dependent thymidylate synthase [Clostridia bacterium]|nr:FAD-dependent thymidylate synthase [Clostridia bacterium]